MRIAINGFGRMGRLFLRALHARTGHDHQVVAINEPKGDPATLALLLEFDSTQGRFPVPCHAADDALVVGAQPIALVQQADWHSLPWRRHAVDLVVDCSGKVKKADALEPHFAAGARTVLVSNPVPGVPNVVFGVNHTVQDLGSARAFTAASCTTNCLAPIVRVLHDAIGIERGLVTTIHDPTNTQSVVDRPDKDPRRARSALVNLIPTTTNSATAVALIVPELQGKLDSIAVRAPVLNSSITDCAFQMARDTTIDEVNGALERAATTGPLHGVLGFERRPLVSSDFARDSRSAIVDGLSTRVVDRRLVKVLAFYDNEWGYCCRMVDLALHHDSCRR